MSKSDIVKIPLVDGDVVIKLKGVTFLPQEDDKVTTWDLSHMTWSCRMGLSFLSNHGGAQSVPVKSGKHGLMLSLSARMEG